MYYIESWHIGSSRSMCQLSLFIIVLSTAFCYTIAQDVCSAECVKALLTPEQGLISLIVRLTNKNSTVSRNQLIRRAEMFKERAIGSPCQFSNSMEHAFSSNISPLCLL